MEIKEIKPPPPPSTYSMEFSKYEGWAIIAALGEYAHRHPDAVERQKWINWAKELDNLLRNN